MKKAVKAILASSLVSILMAFTASAYADEVVIGTPDSNAVVVVPGASCSPGNPCGTYAVLNSKNEVTNIIVCQAAVCGGGSLGGNSVVLQGPTNPNGNGWNGPGYFAGNNAPNPVTYSPQTQVFTVPTGPQEVSTTTPVTSNDPNGNPLSVTLSARVSDSYSTFKAPTSMHSAIPTLTTPKATATATGTLSATGIGADGSEVIQSQTFVPGLTHEQMMFLINNNLSDYLIRSHSDTLIHLLITLGY